MITNLTYYSQSIIDSMREIEKKINHQHYSCWDELGQKYYHHDWTIENDRSNNHVKQDHWRHNGTKTKIEVERMRKNDLPEWLWPFSAMNQIHWLQQFFPWLNVCVLLLLHRLLLLLLRLRLLCPHHVHHLLLHLYNKTKSERSTCNINRNHVQHCNISSSSSINNNVETQSIVIPSPLKPLISIPFWSISNSC